MPPGQVGIEGGRREERGENFPLRSEGGCDNRITKSDEIGFASFFVEEKQSTSPPSTWRQRLKGGREVGSPDGKRKGVSRRG